jgi:hypothetical protein
VKRFQIALILQLYNLYFLPLFKNALLNLGCLIITFLGNDGNLGMNTFGFSLEKKLNISNLYLIPCSYYIIFQIINCLYTCHIDQSG